MPNGRIGFSSSVSLMWAELPVPERFAAARAAGFEAVEIQFFEEVSPVAAAAARAAEMPVLLLNVPMGDFRTGGSGLSGVPGRVGAFREAFLAAADTAAMLGAKILHLGASRIPGGVDREQCLESYRANLRFAVEHGARSGATLVIEPLNRVENPTILLASLDDAAELIGQVGGGLGIQYDLYHATLNGVDLAATFDKHRRLIRHLQFADAPGRHEPGTGSIDFLTFLGHLKARGYDGYLGAEYFPSRPTAETVDWLPVFEAAASR
jgi:hydroxypyruvate isomerase